ncbi:MAG: hypothetical protein ABI432_18125 [Flavobacteriales bacterium]
MKLLQQTLCAALIGASFQVRAQHARIVVEHAGNVQVFTDLTEAILAAENNADLYLSGGTFLVPGGFALDKTLHFIGAGIHNDSTAATGATILTADGSAYFRLTTGASGSSFSGIRFSTPGSNTCFGLGTGLGDQNVESVEFHRCVFPQRVDLGAVAPTASSSAFIECVFNAALNGYDSEAQFTRCIFDYQAGTGAEITSFGTSGLSMLNCVCLGTRVGNCEGATVSNSIFTRTTAPFWQSDGMTMTNNLVVCDALTSNMSGFTESGNILSVPVESIFMSEGDTDYQFSDDLHLQSTCPGVGAGTDGTDIGIYGTDSPYKEGAIPHTPHFRRVEIAPGTNAAGNLPVNVHVAAQTN